MQAITNKREQILKEYKDKNKIDIDRLIEI